MTVSLRQSFSQGSLLATFSKADARDLDSGQPTPEAPRTIFDVLGTIQKLPFRLQARGEFEYVGAKPLGTGCLPDLECRMLRSRSKGISRRARAAVHGRASECWREYADCSWLHWPDHREFLSLRCPGSRWSPHSFVRESFLYLSVRTAIGFHPTLPCRSLAPG